METLVSSNTKIIKIFGDFSKITRSHLKKKNSKKQEQKKYIQI